MTIETVPATATRYHLINFDRHGDERVDDPDAANGRLSDTLADLLSRDPITDVFLMSHGWQGDVPAAKRQYDAWTRAMLDCTADIERIRARRPDFAPLLIGLHWPSLPWGNEEPTAAAVPFAPGAPNPIDRWIDQAGADLADTPRAREALRALFVAAIEGMCVIKLFAGRMCKKFAGPERLVEGLPTV